MSETPRTDEMAFMGYLNAGEAVVSVDFARQLEMEVDALDSKLAGTEIDLEKARAEIESKNRLVEQMREALLLFAEGAIHDFHYVCQHRDNCLCLACQKVRVKAALAAERGE